MRLAAAALCVLAALRPGEARQGTARPESSPQESRPEPAALVFAAASLSAPFEALRDRLRASQPGLAVELHFAGTPQLVAQIREGVRADVLASADEASMKTIVDLGLAAEAPRTFARNTLRIAVEEGNPKRVRGLSDFARPDLRVAIAAPAVPAGRYAREALDKARVSVRPASEEPSVKALVSKVALGEVDAAIVYVTDVRAARGKVSGVEVAPEHDVVARYPIARLREGRAPKAAAAFVDFVTSPAGREVLRAHGFLDP